MTDAQPTEALQDLLNWSARLHDWQRHGLRCLARGSLTNQDLADTLEICRLAEDLPAGKSSLLTEPSASPPEAKPLSKDDLPRKGSAQDRVSLVAVEGVQDVNALAADQRLAFQPGLTVIYGNNASGKSGYARILKRVCRARERESDLLTNVYKPPASPQSKPRATIRFRVGEQEHHLDWTDGGPTAPELPFIQVFDSGCASVQVSERNDIVFTPLALELLQRLGDLCESVKEQLRAERETVNASKSPALDRLRSKLSAESEAGKAARLIHHSTDVHSLRRLATLTQDETDRQAQLGTMLSENPVQLALSLIHI